MSFSKIYRIDEIKYSILKIKPPVLAIQVKGTVTTSGWTKGKLIPYVYVSEPENGVQEFDFIANEPDGIVLDVLTPIVANYFMEIPAWLSGVRVYSSTNDDFINLSAAKGKVNCKVPPKVMGHLPTDFKNELNPAEDIKQWIIGEEDPFPWARTSNGANYFK